jgi:methyl-accepting chemotaxis protein
LRLVAAAPISVPDLRWTAVARLGERDALAPLGRIDRMLALAGALALAAAALAALALGSYVARPTWGVLEAVLAAGQGNLRARSPMAARGELGAVGRGVNALIDQLAQRHGQDATERRRLDAEVQDLIAVIGAAARGDGSRRARVDGALAGLAVAVNGMCASIADLSERLLGVPAQLVEMGAAAQTASEQALREAIRQVDEAERAAGGAERLSSGLGRSAALAARADADCRRSRAAWEEGREALGRMATAVDHLQKGVRASGGKLKRLGERSMQQASVAASFARIAADIGMLSLNAAIEASRAGAPAASSGIVAEELRKLSARADAMREDVARAVEALQADVNEALAGVDRQAEHAQQVTTRLADVESGLCALFEPLGEFALRLADLRPALESSQRDAAALEVASAEARSAAGRLCTLAEAAHANLQTLLAVAAELPAGEPAQETVDGAVEVALEGALDDALVEEAPKAAAGGGRYRTRM